MLKTHQVRFVQGHEKYRELTIPNLLIYARDHLPRNQDYLPGDVEPKDISREYLMTVDC